MNIALIYVLGRPMKNIGVCICEVSIVTKETLGFTNQYSSDSEAQRTCSTYHWDVFRLLQ